MAKYWRAPMWSALAALTSLAVSSTGAAVAAAATPPPPPTVTINDVQAVEGDSGTTSAAFTVSLSEASGGRITVDFATVDSTAKAGADYLVTSGTLVFTRRETTKTVAVPVVGDVLDEDDETFFVNLFNPTRAAISKGTGVGTILDNDPLPFLFITNARANETDAHAVFTVTLSSVSGRIVSVDYATGSTSNSSATAGGDYIAASGTITFSPGQTAQAIAIRLIDDTLDEGDETFVLHLTNPVNAVLPSFGVIGPAPTQAVGTIVDDDPEPTLTVHDATGWEDFALTRTAVQLSAPSGKTVTVDFFTSDGTATAGQDYTATSGTLVFQPGSTNAQAIVLSITDDAVRDPDEVFFVHIANAVNATIARSRGEIRIIDNDP